MSEGNRIAPDPSNLEMAVALLRALIKCDDLRLAKALAHAAIDYATDDKEALAEGAAWVEQPACPVCEDSGWATTMDECTQCDKRASGSPA